MRLMSSALLVAVSGCLFAFGCAAASVVQSEPSGGGGANGDAPLVLNPDALNLHIKTDGSRGPQRGGSDAPPGPNCGNGELTRDEACDDGNTVSGDGCAAKLTAAAGAADHSAVICNRRTRNAM